MSETTEELGARWQSERCPECAFDPNGFGPADLPAAVAGLGRRYQAPLTRFLPGEDVSLLVAHPLPGVWSALAYACHVRDVLAIFDARIARMLTEDAPELGWWDHEAAVEADAYEKQPPAEVAAAIAANAAALSATHQSRRRARSLRMERSRRDRTRCRPGSFRPRSPGW